MGFSLLDMIQKPAEQEGHIKRIPIDHIEPSKNNFYDVSEIAELKASMRMFGDVQIAVVSPIAGTDTYRLISGHRRRLAHLELMAEGVEGFDDMLCYIRDGDPDGGDIASRLLLILSNSTARNLSDYERAQQAVQLKRLLIEYKEAGNEVPGSLRKYVAEALDISETQVQRYETIDKNLLPEIKEAFAEDKISVSVAAEIATEEPDQQIEIFEALQERGDLSVKAVREKKRRGYVRTCDETGEECEIHDARIKKYMKKGSIVGCAGCCKGCLKMYTCEIACQYVKPKQKEAEEITTQNIDKDRYEQIERGDRTFYIAKNTGQQVGQMIMFAECDIAATGRKIKARISIIDELPGFGNWMVIGFRPEE